MKLKKLLSCILVAILSFCAVFALNSCDSSSGNIGNKTEGIDVDLTKLSSTMVYSEVYNMVNAPESYIGKTVKMSGDFVVYVSEMSDDVYPAVIIADATSCCAQGIEFVLANGTYPNDYPKENSFITVVGKFETYFEGPYRYCHLVDAVLL